MHKRYGWGITITTFVICAGVTIIAGILLAVVAVALLDLLRLLVAVGG